jgi:hypothetical protein
MKKLATIRVHKILGGKWYVKCIVRWQGSCRLISLQLRNPQRSYRHHYAQVCVTNMAAYLIPSGYILPSASRRIINRIIGLAAKQEIK